MLDSISNSNYTPYNLDRRALADGAVELDLGVGEGDVDLLADAATGLADLDVR
mgnify:CR=1 FL=1